MTPQPSLRKDEISNTCIIFWLGSRNWRAYGEISRAITQVYPSHNKDGCVRIQPSSPAAVCAHGKELKVVLRDGGLGRQRSMDARLESTEKAVTMPGLLADKCCVNSSEQIGCVPNLIVPAFLGVLGRPL